MSWLAASRQNVPVFEAFPQAIPKMLWICGRGRKRARISPKVVLRYEPTYGWERVGSWADRATGVAGQRRRRKCSRDGEAFTQSAVNMKAGGSHLNVRGRLL